MHAGFRFEFTLTVLLTFSVLQGSLFAQRTKLSLREADDLFRNQSYAAALPVYLEHLKNEPENAMLNYKAGVSYLNSRSMKAKAVPYLEKAVLHSTSYLTKSYTSDKDAPLNAYKHLGDAYYLTYNFPAAIKTYQKYKELLKESKDPDLAEIASTDSKLGMCRLVKDLKPQLTLPLTSGGKPCNGELVAGEYSASLSPDKTAIIYSVKVPLQKLDTDDGSAPYFEPGIPKKVDSSSLNDGEGRSGRTQKKNLELDTVLYSSTIGTSFDGQVVLTYKNDDNDGNLYIIKLKDNKWTTPVRVVKAANTKGWEPHECMSADGNSLYFVSDRAGGYGGKDIYKCTRLSDGEWSKAANLGPAVNTAADEVAPFIHPDNGTLYFSSNRIKPGSYDIFASISSGGQWAKPMNVGYPINRHDHDIFQVTADTKKLFPAAKPQAAKSKDREHSEDTAHMDAGPDSENLLISFVNQHKVPLNILKGKVTDHTSGLPLGVKICMTDNATGEKIGQYHSDAFSGLYSMILPFGKNVGITYECNGYLFWTENLQVDREKNYFEKQKLVSMPLIAEGATATLTNVFFEGNAVIPNSASAYELEKVFRFLDEHPELHVELINHIYSRENKKFNRKLSDKRARAVKEILVQKGLTADRISTSGLSHELPDPAKVKKGKGKNAQKKPSGKTTAPQRTQALELKVTKMDKEEPKSKT